MTGGVFYIVKVRLAANLAWGWGVTILNEAKLNCLMPGGEIMENYVVICVHLRV